MTENVDPWDALAGPSTRTPRSLESREQSERPRSWQPASLLPAPKPRDGYKFRYVRVENRNEQDKINFSQRLREGWEPVQAEDHPEVMRDLNMVGHKGTVEFGGLVLCKMPEEMVAQRNAYYRDHTQRIADDVESNYMRDNNEVMRKVSEKRRQVVFGPSRR